MTSDERQGLFEEKVKNLLDGMVENLEGGTKQKLESIRRKALRGREGFKLPFIPLRWMTVGGFAAVTTASIAMFFWLSTSPVDLPVKQAEDLEIITSKDHIELFQNLDFYQWLAKENGRGKGNVS